MTDEPDQDRAVDLLVDTAIPEALDITMSAYGAVVVGGGMPEGYHTVEGYYVVRVFGAANVGFIKFLIEDRGYGKVIRQLEELV